MNRRKLLTMLGLAPVAAVAAKVAPEPEPRVDIHPDKGESYKDLYYSQQPLISTLEEDRIQLNQIRQNLRLYPNETDVYLEITTEPDGTIVLANPARGTEIRL